VRCDNSLRIQGFTAIELANTAIFSVINAVIFSPLPYPDSDRLVQIRQTNPRANRQGTWVSYPDS